MHSVLAGEVDPSSDGPGNVMPGTEPDAVQLVSVGRKSFAISTPSP